MQKELTVTVTAVAHGWEITVEDVAGKYAFDAFASRSAQIPHRIGELLFRFDWAPEKDKEANKK